LNAFELELEDREFASKLCDSCVRCITTLARLTGALFQHEAVGEERCLRSASLPTGGDARLAARDLLGCDHELAGVSRVGSRSVEVLLHAIEREGKGAVPAVQICE
jgi:hypothetical protein